MIDLELLKYAAKAYGYGSLNTVQNGKLVFRVPGSASKTVHWNPLISDGDALRLAVKLGMELVTWGTSVQVKKGSIAYEEEPSHIDPYAATRRAITKAAASIAQQGECNEIGKTL